MRGITIITIHPYIHIYSNLELELESVKNILMYFMSAERVALVSTISITTSKYDFFTWMVSLSKGLGFRPAGHRGRMSWGIHDNHDLLQTLPYFDRLDYILWFGGLSFVLCYLLHLRYNRPRPRLAYHPSNSTHYKN